MTAAAPPQVVREKISRLTGCRVSVALVCDRDFSPDELDRFFRIPSTESPRPQDFQIEARVVRYECEAEDEPRWRLAFEIYLVKAARPETVSSRSTGGIRDRARMRRLHL
jgi:hypothetical protein